MFPTKPEIRNPDKLYNKAIQALGELLHAIAQDEEPDRDEMLLIKTTIDILYKEKLEQHDNYNNKVRDQLRLRGGAY